MTKDLMRRLEKLERLECFGRPAWQTKLRAFARRSRFDEEEFLAMVKGHEGYLAHAISDNGGITWEAFQLLYGLRQRVRYGSSEPVTPEALPGGEQ